MELNTDKSTNNMRLFSFCLPLIVVLSTASFCSNDITLPSTNNIFEPSIECPSKIVVDPNEEWWIEAKSLNSDVTLEFKSDDVSYTERLVMKTDISYIKALGHLSPKSEVGTITAIAKNSAGITMKDIRVERPYVNLSVPTLKMSCEAGRQIIQIESNFDYKVENRGEFDFTPNGVELNADWCSFKKTDKGIEISVSENESIDSRRTEIAFFDATMYYKKTLVVQQDGIDWRPLERQALMDLWESLGGKNWTNHKNWGTDAPIEEWEGLAFDEEGHVSILTIEKEPFYGRIPESICNLTHLWEFHIHDRTYYKESHIFGPLPESMAKMNLHVLTIHCHLDGPFPEAIRGLRHLWQLDLHGNDITGELPEWLGTFSDNFGGLSIYGNRLTGKVPDSVLALPFWSDDEMKQQPGYGLYR